MIAMICVSYSITHYTVNSRNLTDQYFLFNRFIGEDLFIKEILQQYDWSPKRQVKYSKVCKCIWLYLQVYVMVLATHVN